MKNLLFAMLFAAAMLMLGCSGGDANKPGPGASPSIPTVGTPGTPGTQ